MRQAVGRVRVALHQRHRDDLGLIGRELLQADGLDGRQATVDLHLRGLSDGEVEVADVDRDLQHVLDDGRQVEISHAVVWRAPKRTGIKNGER